MSWWYGDRSQGFVRLVSCDKCGEANRVTVRPVGNIPRKCDQCRAPKNRSKYCRWCEKPIKGRNVHYCSALCRKEHYRIKRSTDEYLTRQWGANLIRKRGGGISECAHCGESVDPRILSKWGYREPGMNAHESAGSAPEATDVDGPSCKQMLEKQHGRDGEADIDSGSRGVSEGS